MEEVQFEAAHFDWKPQIFSWRHKHLVQTKRLREEGKEMFYVDETWVDSNMTSSKCWQGEREKCSAGNRLILLHAGSENGFLHNAMLLYKTGGATWDHHGQVNGTNFEKLVNEKLTPNLPCASVIVLENAPYHSVQLDRVPSKYAVKKA
jgi:hypothetical protein